MAKLTIEIEENEFALHGYQVWENEKLILRDDNFTTDFHAEMAARGCYQMYRLGLDNGHEVGDD